MQSLILNGISLSIVCKNAPDLLS